MNYVMYLRVSTGKQDYGIEVQEKAIMGYLGEDDVILDMFIDKASGKDTERPGLKEAIELCRLTQSHLIVSKLDRLSRNLLDLLTIVEEVEFKIVELPELSRFMLQIYGAVAEMERKMISERTKAGLEVARKRGVQLGNPRLDEFRNSDTSKARSVKLQRSEQYKKQVRKQIELAKGDGMSTLSGIAEYLNNKGVRTIRGMRFSATTVSRLVA